MDAILLQAVEGLGEPLGPAGSEILEWLESEKEVVAKEILFDGPLCHLAMCGAPETEASNESDREIEWHSRSQLEARLRELEEAEDRVIAGAYGHCEDCGAEIDNRRLVADPAVAFCITCQKTSEVEEHFCTL